MTTIEQEQAVQRMVRLFYERGLADPLLGPVFRDAIHDWDEHVAKIADFWSNILYQTGRYKGHPFPAHRALPVEPEHFDRWIALFTETVRETLPEWEADQACTKARLMAQSFKAGLYALRQATSAG